MSCVQSCTVVVYFYFGNACVSIKMLYVGDNYNNYLRENSADINLQQFYDCPVMKGHLYIGPSPNICIHVLVADSK